MITFEYNGQIYKPSNLEKKLKKLHITMDDIKIITEENTNKDIAIQTKENEDKLRFNSIYLFWDMKCKGWLESKTKDLPDTVFRKDDFVYMGKCDDYDKLSEVRAELFKEAIKMKTK